MFWKFRFFRYKIELLNDNPDPNQIKENIVYVVGGKDFTKWAYVKCPNGCGEIIMLSLNKKQFPAWKIKQDKIGRATISPSINKLNGCKSHFFIKKGRLIWAQSDYSI